MRRRFAAALALLFVLAFCLLGSSPVPQPTAESEDANIRIVSRTLQEDGTLIETFYKSGMLEQHYWYADGRHCICQIPVN